jgi:hypothetical protein
MKRVLIYWTKKSTFDIIHQTMEKYNISGTLTINHTMECVVDDTVYSAIQKAQELGYVEIRTCLDITEN